MQILYVPERVHWVTTRGSSTVNSVAILTPNLEEQIVCTYHPVVQSAILMITAVSVQHKAGKTDCGLFAIAFAYHAVIRENLKKDYF